MSFNRLKYDTCEGEKLLAESIGPGLYSTNTPVLCGNCLQTDPNIMPRRTGVSLNSNTPWRFYAGPVDVESDLWNLNRPASRCPQEKYEPRGPANCTCKNQGQPMGQGVVAGCRIHGTGKTAPQPRNEKASTTENFQGGPGLRHEGMRCPDNDLAAMPPCYFGTESTRLSNPPQTLRGNGVNRFHHLCFDPQEQIFFPGEIHVDTREVFKDNHRACIPSLKIISQPGVEPHNRQTVCPTITPTCGAFTGSLYQYDVCG